MPSFPIHMRLFCAVLFCVTLACATGYAAQDPESSGILYWTELSKSGKAQVRYHILVPPEVERPLGFDTKSPNRYTPLGFRQAGTVTYQGTKLTGDDPFSIMHPAPDHTGVRMYFSSGKPPKFQVKSESVSPDSLAVEPPKTKICQYEPGEVFAEASRAWQACCFAAPDRAGDCVYYTRFGLDYFDLIRKSLTGEDDAVIEIEGLWPSVSDDNQRLLYSRRMSRDEKSTATPLAVGVYYADVGASGIPDSDNAITPDHLSSNPNFPFAVPRGTATEAPFMGAIRCGRASWGLGAEVVFPVQDYRSGSGDTSWNIFRAVKSGSEWTYEAMVVDTEAHLHWPTISGDGRWVAYMRHDMKADTYRVVLQELGTNNIVPMGDPDKPGLWPFFDKDIDPPNFELQIRHGNSKHATVVRVIDRQRQTDMGKDSFELYCSGQNFRPTLDSVFTPGTTMAITYERDPAAHSTKLKFTLTTKREWAYGDEYPPYESFDAEIPSEYTEHPIDALYIVEDVRLMVGVLARDNRYLRVETGDMNPKVFDRSSVAANYDDGSWEAEEGLSGRNADPPYFPRLNKKSVDVNYPGVSWWLENENKELVTGTDGAFRTTPRNPNYPPETYPDARPYWFRVLAQDLWGNEVDMAIPVWLWNKKDSVRTLGYESKKIR